MKARTFTDSFSIIKKLTLLLHLITFVVFYGNGQRRNPVDIISNPTAWHPHYCRRLRCIGLSWRRNSKSIENTFGFLFFLCCLFVLHQVEARNWSGSSRFSPPVMFDRIGRVHRAGRRARVESNPQKKKKKINGGWGIDVSGVNRTLRQWAASPLIYRGRETKVIGYSIKRPPQLIVGLHGMVMYGLIIKRKWRESLLQRLCLLIGDDG